MTAWLISVTKNTFGCTMATMSSPVAINIMVWNPFGAMLKRLKKSKGVAKHTFY